LRLQDDDKAAGDTRPGRQDAQGRHTLCAQRRRGRLPVVGRKSVATMSSSDASSDDERIAFRVTEDDEEFERTGGYYGACS